MKNDSTKNSLAKWREKMVNGDVPAPIYLSPIEKAKNNPKSLRAAINAKCWDCCVFNKKEVGLCVCKDCPLWNLRPWQKGSIDSDKLDDSDEV